MFVTLISIALFIGSLILFGLLVQPSHRLISARTWSYLLALSVVMTWVLSPAAPYTNSMDLGAIRAFSNLQSSGSPYLEWANKLALPDFIVEILFYAGVAPNAIGALFSFAGVTLWILAYSLFLQTFLGRQIVIIPISVGLTLFNPFQIVFADVFGFISPWEASSTYGMLGSALLALGFALSLRGSCYWAGSVLLLLIVISPVNAGPMFFFYLIALIASWKDPDTRTGVIRIVYLTLAVTLVIALSRDSSLRLMNDAPDQLADYRTYLAIWDGHRGQETYFLTQTTILGLLLTSLIIIFLSISYVRLKPNNVPLTPYMLYASAVFLVSLIILDFYPKFVSRMNLDYSQLDIPLISMMPLRLTDFAGYLLPTALICFISIMVSLRSDQRRPLISTELALGLVSLVWLGSAWFSSNMQPEKSWLNYMITNIDHRADEETFTHPPTRPESLSNLSSTLVAPGASKVALWDLGLPIILHTENGIDFIPYYPSTVSNVKNIISIGYGVDFVDPPFDPLCGCIPNFGEIESNWKQRSSEDWVKISNDLGIDSVLAPSDWKLNLREVHKFESWSVYQIEHVEM